MNAMKKIKSFFQKYKTETILFSVAFLLRVFILIAILWWQGVVGDFDGRPANLFPIMGGDSTDYYRLAQNLINHRQFSLSENAPFFLESLRVPAYPAFIAVILLLFKSLYAVSIIQDILAALAVVLFYRLSKLFFSERISIAAVILFMLEPSGLFLSNIILTETFFLFLFILFLYVFLKQKENPAIFYFLVSGIILGIATLTRPIAQFIPFFAIVFTFILYRNYPLKKIIVLNAIFIVGFLLIVLPWSIRNKIIFNSFQLSSVGVFNWYNYHIPLWHAQKYGLNNEEEIEKFKARFGGDRQQPKYKYWSLKNAPEMSQIVKEEIKKDPLGYMRFHLIKTIPFFVTDGLRDIARPLKLLALDSTTPNLSNDLASGNLKKIFRQIFSGNRDFNLFLLGFAFWALVSILMIIGIIKSLFERDEITIYVLFFSFLIVYFALATGPVSSGKFRLPVVPLMLLLAVLGFEFLFNKIKQILTNKSYGKSIAT